MLLHFQSIAVFLALAAISLASPIVEKRGTGFDRKCIKLSSTALQQARTEIYNAKIVPDVYKNGFNPKTIVALYYNQKFVPYGENLPMTETLAQPEVYFPRPEGDPADTKYTLIMNDPDVPFEIANPSFLHWIRRGLKPDCQTAATAGGQDVRFYIPPTPPPLLAPTEHRYTFSILREPREGYSPSALSYLLQLTTFDLDEYEAKTGAKVIGSTYFLGSAM